MKSIPLGPTVFQLSHRDLVNCYLVREDDGIILIDTAIDGCAKAILQAAQPFELSILRIVLTHAHHDHVGSLDELHPDVVLMDVEMPGMDGIETTAALRADVSQSAVVMLSIHDDVLTRTRAQAAGAVAFVEKRGTTEHLLAAIRQAAQHTR